MTRPELVREIHTLKRSTGALVLAHNYQPVEIFEVADLIGDSLELARRAATAGAPFIVFCGVRFMAETAKLLSPASRVVLPAPDAGCQMADMITGPALRARRAALGDVTVVAYVNTTADVKAGSDICCTSANAVAVVKSLPPDRKILFVPDRNLARYVARETGRDIEPWEGFCYVHARFTLDDVRRTRARYPDSVLISHPESPLDVLEASDHVASTGGMYRLAQQHNEVTLGTDAGMCDRITRDFPNVTCHPLRRAARCRNMKLTTLDKVLRALRGETGEVSIDAAIANRARLAIARMLEIS